jgi:AraC-like DNA-binding protein
VGYESEAAFNRTFKRVTGMRREAGAKEQYRRLARLGLPPAMTALAA